MSASWVGNFSAHDNWWPLPDRDALRLRELQTLGAPSHGLCRTRQDRTQDRTGQTEEEAAETAAIGRESKSNTAECVRTGTSGRTINADIPRIICTKHVLSHGPFGRQALVLLLD
jgi:hypothetical protein